LFHHWIGHDDVTYSKPHPEPYQQSAKRLQVEPSDCLAVEDSVVGVLSAKAAGMKVALYCPKNTPAPAVNADYVIDCHRELLELLEE
jgi:beta-phosphoglucomutase-like phosphatase (HAD superfamily)